MRGTTSSSQLGEDQAVTSSVSQPYLFRSSCSGGREALQGSMLGIVRAEFGTLGHGGEPVGTFVENVVGVALSHLLS